MISKDLMMQQATGQKVSTSITGQNLQERLYGQGGGGAMGTGDPTGILPTAISQKCLKDKEI